MVLTFEPFQDLKAYMERKLQMLRQLVAQPIPADACDTCPSQVGREKNLVSRVEKNIENRLQILWSLHNPHPHIPQLFGILRNDETCQAERWVKAYLWATRSMPRTSKLW